MNTEEGLILSLFFGGVLIILFYVTRDITLSYFSGLGALLICAICLRVNTYVRYECSTNKGKTKK